MRRHALLVALTATLCVGALTGPTSARADYGEGAFHLGAGPTLFSIENLPDPGLNTFVYGLPMFPYQIGIHGGYLLTPEIYIGAQLALGATAIDGPGGVNADLLFFTILPRFAYQILISESIAAYAGAEVGVTIVGDPDGNPEDIFKAGGLGGIHILPEPSFSIDVEAGIAFVHHPDSANAGIMASLNLILSGWIGGTGSAPAPMVSDDPPPPANDPPPADPEGGLY